MKNAPPDAIPPEEWWLTPAELDFVRARHPTNRLSFALLLLFFRQHCRFPHQLSDINPVKTEVVARQIGLSDDGPQAIALSHRTLERYRSEIRDWFGFRKATVADAEQLQAWLCAYVATVGANLEDLQTGLAARCRELLIEPPSEDRQNRLVGTAVRAHEERLYAHILTRLELATRTRLEALLRPAAGESVAAPPPSPPEPMVGSAPAVLLWLRRDPGRPSLASVE